MSGNTNDQLLKVSARQSDPNVLCNPPQNVRYFSFQILVELQMNHCNALAALRISANQHCPLCFLLCLRPNFNVYLLYSDAFLE